MPRRKNKKTKQKDQDAKQTAEGIAQETRVVSASPTKVFQRKYSIIPFKKVEACPNIVDVYLALCIKYQRPPNPGITIALRYGHTKIKPASQPKFTDAVLSADPLP